MSPGEVKRKVIALRGALGSSSIVSCVYPQSKDATTSRRVWRKARC